MMNSAHLCFRILLIGITILGMSSAVLAQDIDTIEPLDLSAGPVALEFSLSAAGPPTIELLTDGRMTFRIMAVGQVSGSLEGNLMAKVSEVTAMPSPPLHPVTVMFTIETELGTLEGYYAGSLHLADGSEQAVVNASGLILSVSGAYADLYLADVYVSSTVQFVDGRSVGESGILTIAAR